VLNAEFARWMVQERGYSSWTIRAYGGKVKQADRFITATFGRRLIRAREEHVRTYLAQFRWPKTRNVHLLALRRLFEFAREVGYRKTDPTSEIRRLPEPEYLPHPISNQDLRRLRLVAATMSLRHRLILDLALFAGLRRSEVSKISWSDIDLAGRRIRVFGKGRKERILPLHSVLATELELWRLVTPSEEWVLPSPQSYRGHISHATIWLTIKEIGERAGLKIKPHDLRHSFATELLESGSQIERVKELLRHSSLASTQIYTKVSIARLEEDIERLDFGA
jgi:integrase/recombinase XerD